MDQSVNASPFPVELPLRRWGSERGTPRALLLHGLTSSSRTWWRLASQLAERNWMVVAPDLRGHGDAPRTVDYRLQGFAADVLAVRPADGGPWDVVVGHSLGGAVAAVAAGRDHDWTRSMVLLDPVLNLPEDQRDAAVAGVLAELHLDDPAELLRRWPNWHVEDAMAKVLSAAVVSPYVVECVVESNWPWDLRADVANLKCAVRLLGADPMVEAPALHPRDGALLSGDDGHVSFSIVTGSGHSLHRDQPDLVVDEIAAVGLSVRRRPGLR